MTSNSLIHKYNLITFYKKKRKMRKMKKSTVLAGMILLVGILGFTSCEKTDDDLSINDIEGEYIGSFSVSNTLKSAWLGGANQDDGTADIDKLGVNQIQVHCYGGAIDTTFMLDYYEQNDSVMVCLTGDEFEDMYGHMLGDGHMMGGMMGDMGSGQTEWMHHMDDEHNEGDEHFGGFNMQDGTFTYSFQMMDGTTPYYLKFHGVKQ